MRTIVFTFDDGRRDNYIYAFPITKKYNIRGTIFVTTGYVDGTWEDAFRSFRSSEDCIQIQELKDLRKNGWEIGIHGDKHKTEYSDLCNCINKMKIWGFGEKFGFFIPNSEFDVVEIKKILTSRITKDSVMYIRYGRKINTKNFFYRVLYVLYKYLKIQIAYYLFNCKNLNTSPLNKDKIFSVVIRKEDDPKMIEEFIKTMKDNTICVFMLHSIVNENRKYYDIDPWVYSSEKFEKLCAGISDLINKNFLCNKTLGEVLGV